MHDRQNLRYWRKGWLCAAMVGGALALSLTGPAAHATISPGPAAATVAAASPDELGSGAIDERINSVQAIVRRWAARNPSTFGGAKVDGLSSRVDIALTRTAAAQRDRADLALLVHAQEPSWTVGFTDVGMSEKARTELLATVRADLPALRRSNHGILTANVDPADRGIVLEVRGAADVAPAMILAKKRFGPSVGVAVSHVHLASRDHDTPGYFAGIPIHIPDVQKGCTSGPEVTKPGFGNYMLTAGHCTDYRVHGVYHDAYIGYSSATDRSVDAALITGSYAPVTWLGSPSSTTYHLTDRRVVSEGIGTVVCTGGAVTGQVCRNSIVDLDYLTQEGVHTVEACNTGGSRPAYYGDSGSSIYHVDSSGLLYVHGIAIGADLVRCVFYVPMYRLEQRLGVRLVLSGR